MGIGQQLDLTPALTERKAMKGDTPGFWDWEAEEFRPVTLPEGFCPSCWAGSSSHSLDLLARFHGFRGGAR